MRKELLAEDEIDFQSMHGVCYMDGNPINNKSLTRKTVYALFAIDVALIIYIITLF